LSIQQAVKGSKPKTNAVTTVKAKFGEWVKTLKAHVAGLAGYDAIIGIPTLEDGGAVIDIRNRKVHFRAWNVTLDCTIPNEHQKPQGRKHPQRKRPRKDIKTEANGVFTKTEDFGDNDEVSAATTAVATATEENFLPNSLPKPPPSQRHIRKDGNATYYRDLLLSEFDDVLVDKLPNELPPLREINHRIPYKPTKPWIAHKFRLSEGHKAQLEKDKAEVVARWIKEGAKLDAGLDAKADVVKELRVRWQPPDRGTRSSAAHPASVGLLPSQFPSPSGARPPPPRCSSASSS
jgi:hypothetical protein